MFQKIRSHLKTIISNTKQIQNNVSVTSHCRGMLISKAHFTVEQISQSLAAVSHWPIQIWKFKYHEFKCLCKRALICIMLILGRTQLVQGNLSWTDCPTETPNSLEGLLSQIHWSQWELKIRCCHYEKHMN